MISDTLGFWAPGLLELFIIFIVLGIPVVLIALVVIYVSRGSKERQKLHQKMDELANELKRTQEQLQRQKKGESPSKSG